jgi:hypothetical protein
MNLLLPVLMILLGSAISFAAIISTWTKIFIEGSMIQADQLHVPEMTRFYYPVFWKSAQFSIGVTLTVLGIHFLWS